MAKYDVQQVPREVLETLAQVFLDAMHNPKVLAVTLNTNCLCVEELCKSAKVKLRTRSEVDVDLGQTVRRYVHTYRDIRPAKNLTFTGYVIPGIPITFGEAVEVLLAEETEG